MGNDLWKCRIQYEYVEGSPLLSTANAFALVEKAKSWLEYNGREDHAINVYDNQENGLLFVFNNRDTALLLKLAMA